MVTKALIDLGRKSGYLAVGMLAEAGFARLAEVVGRPDLKELVKVLGGIGLGVASAYARNPTLKEVLELAGAYNVVVGVRNLLQQRGVLTFQEPVVEVVEVPEEEKKKKPEFEILGETQTAQVEVF